MCYIMKYCQSEDFDASSNGFLCNNKMNWFRGRQWLRLLLGQLWARHMHCKLSFLQLKLPKNQGDAVKLIQPSSSSKMQKGEEHLQWVFLLHKKALITSFISYSRINVAWRERGIKKDFSMIVFMLKKKIILIFWHNFHIKS